MHVFVGNFTYIVDFMIVEDISSIIDPRLSQVVLGKPFVKISNMTHDLPKGVVRFINGTDEVAYKMPHKIEQYKSLSDLEKEHTKSVYLRNKKDKRIGVEYVMSKILGFYNECLELGPKYVTGMDDEGEVTKFLIENEKEIFTDAGDGVRIYPDGIASPAMFLSIAFMFYGYVSLCCLMGLYLSTRIHLFQEVFSTWMTFGENTRDLGSFGEETDEITDLHQIHEEILFSERRDGVAGIKRHRRDPSRDENPIRTLGDYSKPSHKGYKNTIELPIGNNVVPLRSDTIRLVQNGCSFHGLRSPNQHLKDFLKLVDSLDLDGENRERTRLCLFQFSLRDQASNWLERLPAGSISTWEDLTTCFLA
ncbi:hypothetical protein Tco_0784270 [Tanacetum coccineum]